jgi:GNAT superfamily N-acetyltransferase
MMRIRPAEERDLAAVLGLLAEDVIREVDEPAGVTERQRDALREIAASTHQDILVGEVAGVVVATCQVSWLRHLIYDGGLICQIESVRVSRSGRGRGYGTALMEYVCATARDRGCARVQLTTNAQRTAARRFYERLGFVPSHVGMKLYLEEAA